MARPKHIKCSKLNAILKRSVTQVKLKKLKEFPGNPRKHPPKQLHAVCRSIDRFGFITPIVADENHVILAGHCRFEAAKKLKLKRVPVIIIQGLSDNEKHAYVIADNKLSQLSHWDDDKLRSNFKNLLSENFEIEDTGFTTAEIDLLIDGEVLFSSSDKNELTEEDYEAPPVTKKGDIWLLGKHKIICGNSLKRKTYEKLLGNEIVSLIISDPPYNVPIEGHVSGLGKKKHKNFAMACGEMSQEEFINFLKKAIRLSALFAYDNTTAYYFMDWRHIKDLIHAAESTYGPPKQVCIWVKDKAGMGSFYRSQFEMVFVFRKIGEKGINNFELGQHGRYRTNVWNYPGMNTFTSNNQELLKLHPTVKPMSLIADAIRDCSNHNDIVLDSFAGSGTIIHAAERTGRRARAIEFEPKYVDVALQRWMRASGKEAILEKTGQKFTEVMADRLGNAEDL